MRPAVRRPAVRPPAVVLVLVASLAGPAGSAHLAAQEVDTLAASAAVDAFGANCRALGEGLWGRSLCGPHVLVHAPTRAALASRRDPGGSFTPVAGVYAGRLPDGMPMASTAVTWDGERWAMVLLPLPTDRRARYALLAHEAFHRAQPELGLEASDPASPHLDQEEGRVWLRLELRALARALEATGDDAARAALDALLFRAHRHALYPGADTLEAALELNEGLAEYTGLRYAAMMLGEDVAWTARRIRDFESTDSFVRSFAYATGPALGLLLDRLHPDWRPRAVHGHPLAALLADALPTDALLTDARRTDAGAAQPVAGNDELTARAAVYDHAAVAIEEAQRAARLAARLDDIRRRLLEGPTLLLRQSKLSAVFNPNELVPVADATYYPTGSFTAAWGRVEVREGGALLSRDWSTLRLPSGELRIDGDVVRGGGWTLELAEGWSVRETDGGWELGR